MIDDAFEPFSPRRRVAATAARPTAPEEQAALPEFPTDTATPVAAAADAEPLPSAATLSPPNEIAQPLVASDEECIRTAAIELAAVACARALRYALDRNPRLLARFVDDALRAAGAPMRAIVRVAPTQTSVLADACAHEIVADPALSLGDVFIDCAAGTLGATVDERAALLVRALAA